MQIFLKTEEEIELMRAANLLVGKTLAELGKAIRPGVTTLELDKIAEEYIRDNGAVPTFKGFPNPYGGPFPASICTSVNDEVVHGIPNDKPLQDGDIVSVDCGTLLNGFCGDSCYTFCVGEVSEEVKQLLKTTKEALYKGIEAAQLGRRIGEIGYAVQSHCEAQGFGVVKEFVGHGIGRNMHEDPQVPNFGKRGDGKQIKNGLCIAIEPMITMGSPKIGMMSDRWTVKTLDHKPAAHFEHTIAIHQGRVDILSSFDEIEKIEKN
ncbi:MAG: type I methionyl aminopeptidase [Bacteroidaceae bacterium]|nr:type I methionyl aminopeptidase [Bacteroidaceae bacterium]MCF0197728.1 type I methionyl aminopeptidase [Bacteroidaceae bacterium]